MKVFSAVALDHINDRRNDGRLEGATHCGVSGVPGDGPYIRIWLKIEGDTVEKATYECNGCPSSTAAASVAAMLVTGRETGKAALLTGKDLLLVLGGLPEGKEHFADKAAEAVGKAVNGRSIEREK